MERLTKRIEDENTLLTEVGDTACKCFCDNYTLSGCWECPVGKAIEKLADYEDLEEQGLLVRLPCKVGDSVFIIVRKDISKQKIRKIEISDCGIIFKTNRQKRTFSIAGFGESVFLTREEAEKKLEEIKC